VLLAPTSFEISFSTQKYVIEPGLSASADEEGASSGADRHTQIGLNVPHFGARNRQQRTYAEPVDPDVAECYILRCSPLKEVAEEKTAPGRRRSINRQWRQEV